jgi:hypothetical protein
MFSDAVWSKKPHARLPVASGPPVIVTEPLVAEPLFVKTCAIAASAVPVVSAPLISQIWKLIPVRAVEKPLIVTEPSVGDAGTMPAHTAPEHTPDTNCVVACCE